MAPSGEAPNDAAPVVLLAGCGLPRVIWRPVAEALTGPVILLDRPGLGTPWLGQVPTLAEEVATLADLLRCDVGEADGTAPLRPATVVAHSMAALHAEALLLQHPELVGALVLVDPSIELRPLRRWPHAVEMMPRLVPPISAVPGVGSVVSAATVAFTRLQTVSRLDDDLAAELREVYRDEDAQAMAVAESIGYRGQAADLSELRGIRALTRVPTTILTASGRPASRAQEVYRAGLGAHEVRVAGSRHLMMLDAPAAVLAAIRAPGQPVAGGGEGAGTGAWSPAGSATATTGEGGPR